MKNYAILTAINVMVGASMLFAQLAQVNTICFDPRTAKHYNAQGYAGYTFTTTNGNTLTIETLGNPGAVICTRTAKQTEAEKRFDKIWPNTGC